MTKTTSSSVEQRAINTIRTLAMDAVEAAGCGHPGTPMALAPVAYTLWNDVLRFDPETPQWAARDRFVLSCGHASMLLYATLHLAGVKKPGTQTLGISLDDVRRFRQLHSPCAGHPEVGEAPGIETTTGPLGQGVGNSVGMAIAARWFAARYDRPGHTLFGFNVYALCSDGDLMEGVAHEAASLAGHLGLGNLCWVYDDNRITIEGDTGLAFSEDVGARFAALGWQVLRVADANDLAALRAAYAGFQTCQDRPTLIIVRSQIAYGAPHAAGTSEAHGAKLGAAEVKATKEAYGWPADAQFLVPPEVREHFAAGVGARGKAAREDWDRRFAAYRTSHPEAAAEFLAIQQGQFPAGWEASVAPFPASPKGDATRNSSGKVLNQFAAKIPQLLGGSADLAPSTKTLLSGQPAVSRAEPGGRNFHFGIREHGMGAILNGMALCGLRPYGATFLVFADYCRPAIRLSAIMRLGVTYVFTHDSIGVGEDGPTHQPVEHLAALRSIPRLLVIRPCDSNEAAVAWRTALAQSNRPTALVLTRQNVPTLDRTQHGAADGLARGGYVLRESGSGPAQVILMATGSEVSLALAAQETLAAEGIATRVVSLPCGALFDEQDAAYRASVLPREIRARVAVEAGVEQGWSRYLGTEGRFVGMCSFGASAPAEQLYEHFRITAQEVVRAAKESLALVRG